MTTNIFKLIYLTDGGLHELEYTYQLAPDNCFYEVGGKERLMTIDYHGLYPRLMHVCKDLRRRTVGQYPSWKLGMDWAESLQKQYSEELRQVRGEVVYDENVYNEAIETIARQVIAMSEEDAVGENDPNAAELENIDDYLAEAQKAIEDKLNIIYKPHG